MKYLIIFLVLIVFIDIFISKSCGIGSIYKPNSSPIIVYLGNIGNSEYKFTVLRKEHLSTLQVENEENVFTDKNSGENWFVKKQNSSDKNGKLILNLCKNLHIDNTNSNLYSGSKLFSRYSSQTIPNNVSFKKTKDSSFLQIEKENLIKESKNELTLDRLNQEVEEELEETMKPSQKIDEYKDLNNEANIDKIEINNNQSNDGKENYIFG